MMADPLIVLALTAGFLGCVHTLLGPDHYLPFVMMGRAWGWSRAKTVVVTLLCGIGHVLSSVVLGIVGIALGIAVAHLEKVEAMRAQWATWGLIAFGLVYFVWGFRRARRHQPHSHDHAHEDGTLHRHTHVHEDEHLHVHMAEASANAKPVASATPWVLFTIFVFGPCEPLIPLVMIPAAQHSTRGVILVTSVFGLATLVTMTTVVLLCLAGLNRLKLGVLERYTHALAGATLALCGLLIEFLGV